MQVRRLVALQRELVRREGTDAARALAGGVALVAAGVVGACAAFVALVFGVGMALALLLEALGMPREHAAWAGPVVSSLLTAAAGAGAAFAGLHALRRTAMPRTSTTIRETSRWVRQILRGRDNGEQ